MGNDGTIILAQKRANVSIHAPVKGRQRATCPGHQLFFCFNPRPREGATDGK